jgi:hypothetical protein
MVKDLPVLGSKLEPYTDLKGQPSARDYPLLNAVSPYKVTQEKQPEAGMLEQYQTKKIDRGVQKRADEEFMASNQKVDVSGNMVRYIDDNGSLKKIDLSPVSPPRLTGNTELDKIRISSYNSDLTSQIKDIAKLEELKMITSDEAEKKIKELTAKKISTKKPKKLTLKKISLPKIPAPVKVKKITVKRPTKNVKSLRGNVKKISVKKLNLNAKI